MKHAEMVAEVVSREAISARVVSTDESAACAKGIMASIS